MTQPNSEQLVTALFTALKRDPSGATIDANDLSREASGVYAIGGFVQSFDGFGALLYRIVDDLRALLDSEEFYGEVERLITRNLDAIREHGHLGAWYANGELFIDVVECWECRCHEADQGIGKLGTTVVRLAVMQAHRNEQDAIGHVCATEEGNYRTIYLNEVA
jgi:hypothetical protein